MLAAIAIAKILQILLILVFLGDRRLKRAMVNADRFLAWSEAAELLKAGRGTVIANWRLPTGPARTWWTPDDLISAAPTPLPKSLDEAMDCTDERLSSFAQTVFERYLHEQDGTAKLVRKSLLSHVLALEKPLSAEFRRARILSLVELGPQYYVHQGETDP